MNHSLNTVEKIRNIVGVEEEAEFNRGWAPGAITERESQALASIIRFVNAQQWQRAGLRIPLQPTEAVSNRGARAKLYIVQYSMRMYGLTVIDDLPNETYSGWFESNDPSPLTGLTVAPLFYYSKNEYVRRITDITPNSALENGILQGRGLGDDGTGGGPGR